MRPVPAPLASRLLALLGAVLIALAFAGCAGLPGRDPVRMNVVGLEPMPGEGMEMRFRVKLRVQNPNDTAIEFDGIALELEINDRSFATGVSDQKGSVPRFGETVVGVPVSVSALAAVRQALGLMDGRAAADVPYVLHARLGGPLFAGMRFTERGTLELPAPGKPAR
ncbi:LEA/WHy family protein [Thauera sinica]|uniref:LEA type 2 family protein n=1 Tax=Thauera sinica TaxID=2665146 RepID=A0ABW1ARY0_9RHOO|nr:LEA type 2 family protein [Thauera sp. K11]ATE62114.1 Water stress and hypersensitive response domain-containing protein [Thauera sp. K11]